MVMSSSVSEAWFVYITKRETQQTLSHQSTLALLQNSRPLGCGPSLKMFWFVSLKDQDQHSLFLSNMVNLLIVLKHCKPACNLIFASIFSPTTSNASRICFMNVHSWGYCGK